MSKLAVFVGVPTAVAVVGLAVWNLQLQGEIEALRTDRDVVATDDARPAGAAERPTETQARTGARAGRREEARSAALEDRLRALEERLAAAPAATTEAAAAHAEPGAVATSEDLPAVLRTAEFGRAVTEVLDAREEARRKERLEREAAQRARRLLRGLEVSEAQQADVQRVTEAYLLGRDEARRALGEEADREARRAAGQAAEADWHAALSGILDAAQMETVLERTTERRQDPRRQDPRRQNPRRQNPRRGGPPVR